ncbi:MAG TPA: hypothetical protein VFG04_02490 [Planctomycetaceae bacterium]|jgi:hypothetical protein|nr:hypothetical protein [Planctomycetaceae bacterium]
MHIVGKILIGLLAIAAAFGFIIAARLVNTRGDWMKQVQAAKANDEKSAQGLIEARQAFEESRADLEREMLRWDRYFSPVKGAFDATTNAIIASAGKTAGIQPNKELYAFQIGDNGSTTYVGSFNAAEVQANESGLKATFPVRAQDVATWNGQNFRLRTVIPSAFVSQFADLQSKLVTQDELLKKQEKNLLTQGELSAAAREQREARVAELLGGGEAKAAGLVAEINRADDDRNASLARVDELRRKIREAKIQVTSLIQTNNELAASLPGQPPREHAEAGSK